MYKNHLKRIIDFVIVTIILFLIWPIFLLVSAILYVCNDGAGVFFLQERPGLNGRFFKIIKFKTMNDKRGEDGILLPDLMRITKFGNFIRKSSIDELPQLINVFKGDMALIGPRPLLKQYLPLYSKEQARRHEVRPGISGWAQVNGRNNLSWNNKFKLDVWYVDNVSLLLDIKIIIKTILKIFDKKDINNTDVHSNITMQNFDGTN